MSEEVAYRNLADAIVLKACKDWRAVCKKIAKGKPAPYERFGLLRRFFKSEWCELLCGEADPLFILEELEKERDAAERPIMRRGKR